MFKKKYFCDIEHLFKIFWNKITLIKIIFKFSKKNFKKLILIYYFDIEKKKLIYKTI